MDAWGNPTFAHRPVQMNETAAICSDEQPTGPIPDYREAQAELLEHFANRLRNGEYGGDFGGALILVARAIEARI